MTASDEELMVLIGTGDPEAYALLYTRYHQPLHRHLLGMLRDTEAAADVLQETLLRAWTHADQWDGRGTPRAWLFRTATNLALNHIRAARRRPQQPLVPPAESANPEDEISVPSWMIDTVSLGPDDKVALTERNALLRRLVAELPREKQEVLRLVHEAGMEIAEAAQALGIPPGTVKSRLHYATRRLARAWREADE